MGPAGPTRHRSTNRNQFLKGRDASFGGALGPLLTEPTARLRRESPNPPPAALDGMPPARPSFLPWASPCRPNSSLRSSQVVTGHGTVAHPPDPGLVTLRLINPP